MKPTMDCREARAHAPLFVGEDLESDALEAVRAHLEACAECAAQVGALERALRAFEVERVRVDPRVDLWSGIERELVQSGHLRASPLAAASRSSAAPVAFAAPAPSEAAASAVLPHRTLAGARRWFAVAAAAAVAAWVLNAWFSPDAALPDGPGGAGPMVVRNTQATPVSAPNPGSTPEGAAQGARVSLVADAESSDKQEGAPVVAAQASGTSAGLVAAEAPGSLTPGPLTPIRHEGLRRVSGDEALLRESLAPWRSESGYSLAGYPGVR